MFLSDQMSKESQLQFSPRSASAPQLTYPPAPAGYKFTLFWHCSCATALKPSYTGSGEWTHGRLGETQVLDGMGSGPEWLRNRQIPGRQE